MRIRQKVSIAVMSTILLLTSVTITSADDKVVQQKDNLEQTIKLNEQAIASNRQQIDELDRSISDLELFLNSVENNKKDINNLLIEQDQKIKNLNEQIDTLRKQKVLEEYNKKVSLLDDLLYANQNLFNNTDALNFDNYIVDSSAIKDQEEQVKILEMGKEDLLNNKDVHDETSATMSLVYSDMVNKFVKRVQLENYLMNENELSQNAIAEIKSKLEKDLRQKSMYVFLSNRGDNGTNMGLKIVDTAKKYLGVPYVWGGTSAKGMDCSGLVLLVMNELGIKPPRVSLDQSHFGKDVALEDIQPGDLLFFDTLMQGHVTHVGIYIGNGELLHAPQTGDVVKISKLSRYFQSAFINAKRY